VLGLACAFASCENFKRKAKENQKWGKESPGKLKEMAR